MSEVIIGRNAVLEALKSDREIEKITVAKGAEGSVKQIVAKAKDKKIPLYYSEKSRMDKTADGGTHQGVIAVVSDYQYSTVDDILALAEKRGEKPFVIILDGLEDPHNLGAIMRSAEGAGAHGVIIPKRRSAALNSTVYKTSAGAASWLPVARVANIPAALDQLKENGVWIYGTDASGEDYTNSDMTGSVGLVIGSEGFGMGRLVREKCDFLLKLPMYGKITSLNASVAAGIFMYETVRQRNTNKAVK